MENRTERERREKKTRDTGKERVKEKRGTGGRKKIKEQVKGEKDGEWYEKEKG